MFETAALVIGIIGAAFIADKTSGKSVLKVPPKISEHEMRRRALQAQINKYLAGNIYPDYTQRMLTAKEGGAHGVPASSLTMKYILMYDAGVALGYYNNLGDIFHQDIFNRVTNGQGGAWTASDFPVGNFTFTNIEKFTVDEGNDFGLARNTGTWLEENFNFSCLVSVIAGTAATIATGGSASAPVLAVSINQCSV